MAENKVFESIMNGLSESLAYAKGDTSKANFETEKRKVFKCKKNECYCGRTSSVS